MNECDLSDAITETVAEALNKVCHSPASNECITSYKFSKTSSTTNYGIILRSKLSRMYFHVIVWPKQLLLYLHGRGC